MHAGRPHLEFLGLAALEPWQATNLSGGQQKLFRGNRSLARERIEQVLLTDPAVMLIDEPTASISRWLYTR